MSYKALYRTHRPTTFEEVVGQEHITNTLKNIIEKDRVSHAYLFAGPRGTGKTSVAHVFARTLNCSDLVNLSKPCTKCEQCLLNPSLDIVEIDAASNNGVADIRSLIDNAKYAPSISKYKIYIIDEVHMLSKGAFNALLKTLEEPPKHVVFILATTEPHKIPVTILSRTQRFNFRRITEDIISAQLVSVLNKESIKFDSEAIRMISKLSNGGMRDALSIADQASAFSNGNISFNSISQVFGIVSTENLMNLILLAYKKQTKELLSLSTEFIDNGGDIERITGVLIDILKDFIVYSKTEEESLITSLTKEEAIGFKISTTFAYGAIDAFMKLLSDLRISEVPRQAFELTLLKLTEIGNFQITENSRQPIEEKLESMFKTQEVNIEKKGNIYSTQELSQQSKEMFNEDKMKEIQQKIESTKEFEIPQQIIDGPEKSQILSEVENDILSKQSTSPIEPEVEVMEMFSLENEDSNSPELAPQEIKFSVEEIINLLVQANMDELTNSKKTWETMLSHSSNPNYGTFANLLNASKIISAGKDFLLLSSNDDIVISQINNIRKDKNFIEFLNIIFETPKLIFSITRPEFDIVKDEWRTLNQSGKLPQPKPVEKLMVAKKEMSEAEGFGTSIFGDLFNS